MSPAEAVLRASALEDRGDLRAAADLLDAVCARDRALVLPFLQRVLDRLAVVQHGIAFRYIPAGTFSMGDEMGEPDERPVHDVTLPGFWIAQTPLTATQLDPWRHVFEGFARNEMARMRRQYERRADAPSTTDDATAVAAIGLSHVGAQELAQAMTAQHDDGAAGGHAVYRLPTEAEWERAARGCRVGAAYPWGDEPPDGTRASVDAFASRPFDDAFALPPLHGWPPNDYGLFAVVGCVWQWCEDDYVADAYAGGPHVAPVARIPPEALRFVEQDRRGIHKVARGGSWADDAAVLRVAFRGSLSAHATSPTVGVRLVRASPR